MNLLSKNGFEVEGCNVGMEESIDKNFDIEDWLKQRNFKVVALDLHFNAHSYDSVRLAEISKRINPDAKTVLGGFTATHFCREIVRDFGIDVVIKGDAEKPLLRVVKEICKKGEPQFEGIPNIVFKNGESVKENPLEYVADEEVLDSLDFTDPTLLNNYSKYYRTFFEGYNSRANIDRFWISAGRGCHYNCSYCGGSKMSHLRLCGREKPIFRSPKKIAEDTEELHKRGIEVVMVTHDLQVAGKKYWDEYFREIRRSKVDVGIYMGIWQLFEKDFLDDIVRTFDMSRSWLVMSPTSGNDYVRNFNGKHYTNHEFLERLNWLKDVEAQIEIYFGMHLPKESNESHEDSVKLAKKVKQIYLPRKVRLFGQPIMLDPCCLMSIYPEKFGIKPLVTTFRDYYQNNKEHYEKVRMKDDKRGESNIRYFSHETENVNDPSQVHQMKRRWDEAVYSSKGAKR
jgi:radical SAM superfamily enzyme YgiQ (UPF0313 family)